MPDPYAILRTQKLSTHGEIAEAGRHNERLRLPTNAASNRAADNRVLIGGPDELLPRVTSHLSGLGIKPRKNGVLAIEYFLGTSPGWEGDIQAWLQDSMDWLIKRHGVDNILSAVLHLDEKTPHLQTVVVPIDKRGRLNCKSFLGGTPKMCAMQNDYWEAVKHHGLARGEHGSKRRHVPMKQLYRNANLIENAAKSVVKDVIDSAPKKGILESDKLYASRLADHVNEGLKPIIEQAQNGIIVQAAQQAAAAAGRRAEKEKELRVKAENNAEQLRKEQANRVRELPVADVLSRLLGVEPRKEGGALIIETDTEKYVVNGAKFYEHKGGVKKGGGAIDATKCALDCDYLTAVRWLITEYPATDVTSSLRAENEREIGRVVVDAQARPISLADKMGKWAPHAQDKWHIAERYLIEVRGIDPAIIGRLRKSGDLWANHRGSVCFAHRAASGDIVGATVRGTIGDWKQVVGRKADGFFRFIGADKPTHIAITEAPIDAMALCQSNMVTEPAIYASTAGTGGIEAVMAYAVQNGLSVVAAQDADASGDSQAGQTVQRATEIGLSAKRLRPPCGKDWADYILFVKQQVLNMKTAAHEVLSSIFDKDKKNNQETTRKL